MNMDFLKKETLKLKKGQFELECNRLNWNCFVRNAIKKEFDRVASESQNCNYPFQLYSHIGYDAKNESTVQLSSGVNKTGVVREVKTDQAYSITAEFEKGAALVASFSSVGNVALIIYPYRSESLSTIEDSIILFYDLPPVAITQKVLKKAISRFFLYTRYSSVYGFGKASTSFWDRLKVKLMVIIDIRNRRKVHRRFYSFFTEWSKLIFAGAIGYIVAILTKGV